MIRLHLFGAPRLEGDERVDFRSIEAQPRRVALLAYLAFHTAGGGERRDALLGVFWPDSDTAHARGALRNALHFLRRSLGPEVIQSRGNEQVRVDPDLLWCDAVEFERAVAAGDLRAALHLYRADFLEGFFVSGAPEFDHWLEAKRNRLRTLAADAARRSGADAEAAGDLDSAVRHLRRALELAPTDESTACSLMRLLARSGDRGAVLETYRSLAARLEDLGLEPAESTRAVAEELREVDAYIGSAASPSVRADETIVAPPAAGPRADAETGCERADHLPGMPREVRAEVSTLRRRAPRRFRSLMAAAVLGSLVLVTATHLLARWSAEEPSPNVLAVLPLEFRGAPEHAPIATEVATLLALRLDGAGDLRLVESRTAQWRGGLGDRTVDSAGVRRTAAHGAGFLIGGSITESRGRLRVRLTLDGALSPGSPGPSEIVVDGVVEDFLSLVDQLALAVLHARHPDPFARAAIRTAGSIDALKVFLAGEDALARADLSAALEAYRGATEIDSAFALASYRLSSTAYTLAIPVLPERAAEAAVRHAAPLAREDSLLVAAWMHHVGGDIPNAYRLYHEARMLRPDHVEAAFQQGELIFHWGSTIGIGADEAREPFARAFAGAPDHLEAALHLTRLVARDGDVSELDALAEKMHRAAPAGRWSAEVHALRAFLSGDADAQDRAVELAGRRPAGGDRWILEGAAVHTGRIHDVERVTRSRLGRERTRFEQARFHLLHAHLLLAQGRFREADIAIGAADALPLSRRLEYRAMLSSLPFGPAAASEAGEVASAIARFADVTSVPAPTDPLNAGAIEYPPLLFDGMYAARRLLFLGLLSLRTGDPDAALAVADSLAGLPGSEYAPLYRRIVLAATAAARGDHPAALEALGPARPPPTPTFESLVDYGRVSERWLRAELLRETGRHAEALRWYATIPDPLGRDLPYLALAHLRRAWILDAAGEPERALRHYRTFVDLWRNADPELQPTVDRARRRVEELIAS